MAARIPRHALSLLGRTARLAAKHGFKGGLTRAASKANPALLVIEAVVSVAEAVDSYLVLARAREHENGLRRLIPHEEERLRLERKQLSEELTLAREEVAQKQDMQRRLGALVLLCGRALTLAWAEIHAIRSSDLPDLEAFAEELEMLDSAWSNVRRALANYNNSSA